MPVAKTSYETTIGSVFPSKKLENSLKEALVSTNLSQQNFGVSPIEENHLVFVAGLDSGESHIPAFIHPYLIENYKGQSYLIADIRAFKNSSEAYLSQASFEKSVRNKTEYVLTKNRAILDLKWVSGEYTKLRSKFSFAGSVFAAWISQSVSKAYGLDFQDQRVIMAIAMYYYHTLFTADKVLQDKLLEIAVIHTIKATKLSSKEVDEIFAQMTEINDVNDLCGSIKKIVNNVRLQDFSLAMLLTLVQSTWYGNSARELISVALEHPPTWIAIVFAALTERTYKTSSLYRLIETTAKNSNVNEFKLNYLDEVEHAAVALESIEEEIVFKDF